MDRESLHFFKTTLSWKDHIDVVVNCKVNQKVFSTKQTKYVSVRITWLMKKAG